MTTSPKPAPPEIPRTRTDAFWRLAVVALLLLAYGRFFAATYFTQDDYVWLFFGKAFQQPLAVFWRDTLCGQFFRPVAQLWWSALHVVGGEKPLAYQAAFLGIHAVNSVLAALLTRRVADRPTASFVGLLFALSPLFVSPISNYFHYNGDVLGFTFYLAALIMVFDARNRSWRGAASLPLALLAYFSKEAFFTLPGAVILVAGLLPGKRVETEEVDKQSADSPGWSLRRCWRQRVLLFAHLAVWIAALAWRSSIIGRVGGYSMADISGFTSLVNHLLERTTTFIALAGSSLTPHISQLPVPSLVALAAVVLVWGLLFWRSAADGSAVGPIWIAAWLAITWAPSALMTTFAPVSWYAGSFGTALLTAQAIRSLPAPRVLALLLALYYSLFAFGHYRGREAYVAQLRQQHRALRAEYPLGGFEARRGARIFLFRSCPDLFPDAIVKYGVRPGDDLPDVMFLNSLTPVDWIITGEGGPDRIRPMQVSPEYQNGFMEMKHYRVYPIVHRDQHQAILRAGPPFRFMRWENDKLVDITEDQPTPPATDLN